MSFQSTLAQTALPQLIAECQAALGKSNEQIGKEVGFEHPGIFPLIMAGSLKLPISRVPKLAVAINYPVFDLLRLVLRDQTPELLEVIDQVWPGVDLTANERKLIDSFRYLAKGNDVVPIVMDGQSIIALVAA